MSTKVQNPDSMAERTLENRLGEFLGSWWVSSSAVSNWGGSDLRFLRMKKPARVAERKTRMNLRGHISVLNLSDGRRQRESERETIEKCEIGRAHV